MKRSMFIFIAFLLVVVGGSSIFADEDPLAKTGQFDLSAMPLSTKNVGTNIKFTADGYITVGDSAQVPFIYEGAKRYGMVTSEVMETPKPFQSVTLQYNKIQTNNLDTVRIEARGSSDNVKWTEWNTVNESNAVDFYDTLNFVQYRITFISGSTDNLPKIKDISLKFKTVSASETEAFKQKKMDSGASLKKDASKPQTNDFSANAISVSNPFVGLNYATREGLVGGTTANGHVIKATDIFVALPSSKALNSSPSGTDYTVDVTYNGKTYTNVPVWDIGPFNDKDDHWNPNTGSIPVYPYTYRIRDNWGYEGYGDLSRGTGETWSAKNSGFHNGWTSSHTMYYSGGYHEEKYVSETDAGTQVHDSKNNPLHSTSLRNNGAEIDLSDALFYGLGMTDNALVTVKYNWVTN